MNWIEFLKRKDTRPWVQFIRYGVVGASATVVHLIVFSILSLWVLPAIDQGMGDSVRATRSTVNTTIAFLVSNSYCYWLNRRLVFVPGRHSARKEFLLFFLVSGLSFGMGGVVNQVLIGRYGVPTYAAQGAYIATSVMINYVCRRLFVFKS